MTAETVSCEVYGGQAARSFARPIYVRTARGYLRHTKDLYRIECRKCGFFLVLVPFNVEERDAENVPCLRKL